jgi:hypothetical protein
MKRPIIGSDSTTVYTFFLLKSYTSVFFRAFCHSRWFLGEKRKSGNIRLRGCKRNWPALSLLKDLDPLIAGGGVWKHDWIGLEPAASHGSLDRG